MALLTVYKNRTNRVPLSMGRDVSIGVVSSQIRIKDDVTSLLLATWTVEQVTDGSDGELVLVLDETSASQIQHTRGYMDLKITVGSDSFPVISKPIEVFFQGAVTQ